MKLAEGLGYLGLVLVVASSGMRTMTPLRVLSIASNLTFISYSLAEGLLPLLILYGLLLPINSFRLFQMQKLMRNVKEATQGDLALEGLLPFMTRRKFKQGELLFRKDELAHEMPGRSRGREPRAEVSFGPRAAAAAGRARPVRRAGSG